MDLTPQSLFQMQRDGLSVPLPTPQEEAAFYQWVQRNKINEVFHPAQHYDYVGAFRNGIDRGEGDEGHFPDTFKLPGHPTFSIESKYYRPWMKSGKWEGEKYTPINPLTFTQGFNPAENK